MNYRGFPEQTLLFSETIMLRSRTNLREAVNSATSIWQPDQQRDSRVGISNPTAEASVSFAWFAGVFFAATSCSVLLFDKPYEENDDCHWSSVSMLDLEYGLDEGGLVKLCFSGGAEAVPRNHKSRPTFCAGSPQCT
jgi:hypothetical protein